MQDLRVIGVENGALLVAADDGTRFRVPIDEVLQSKLRQTVPDPGSGPKLSPKEIQAHIRSGMSAQDVASVTGVPLEYIQKYEGPVLAEREYIVDTALAVAVHTADADPLTQGTTFGSVIRERLYDLGATDERWASWKESGTGWIVKLAFTANQVDHDARWTFDPKKLALSPMNGEATTLSQQGEAAGALIPRLRAVTLDERSPDSSRFDSGAFDIADSALTERPAAAERPKHEPGYNRPTGGGHTQPIDNNQTADLLEALRRRRGEREAANFDDEESQSNGSAHPSTGAVSGGIRIVDIPLDHFDDDEQVSPKNTAPQPSLPSQSIPQKSARKSSRQSMPSWDEIVFGARTDDDLI